MPFACQQYAPGVHDHVHPWVGVSRRLLRVDRAAAALHAMVPQCPKGHPSNLASLTCHCSGPPPACTCCRPWSPHTPPHTRAAPCR